MKIALVTVICVLGCAFAAPPLVTKPRSPAPAKDVVPIIAQETEVEHDGSFHYSFETGDGTKVEQHGELKQIDEEHAGESVGGSVEYTGDDGQVYHLTYTADETGYHPEGDHLPVAPPIPPQIARALEYLKSVVHEEE